MDILGDITIIRNLSDFQLALSHPSCKTVLLRTSPVEGEYRVHKHQVLYNKSLFNPTIFFSKQNKLTYYGDINQVYYNKRYQNQRSYLKSYLKKVDRLLVVGSGIGPLSIALASLVKQVYSLQINVKATKYQNFNKVVNKIKNITIIPMAFTTSLFNMINPDFVLCLAPFCTELNEQIVKEVKKNKTPFIHYKLKPIKDTLKEDQVLDYGGGLCIARIRNED